jgi:hypothetical protein
MISIKILIILCIMCFAVGTWTGMVFMALLSVGKASNEEVYNGNKQQEKR